MGNNTDPLELKVFSEKKEVQIIVGLFSTDMPLQALHMQLHAAEHHIRIFNSLFDDDDHLLSPALAIKRLEELYLATFLLVSEDENGKNNCNGVQLQIKGVGKIIKLLMEVGRNCGSGLMKSLNVSILVRTPLVHKLDPGGIKQGESILESATTCACHGNQCLHAGIVSSMSSNNLNLDSFIATSHGKARFGYRKCCSNHNLWNSNHTTKYQRFTQCFSTAFTFWRNICSIHYERQ